jgi:ABC-2 type transport system permease protein
MRKRISSSLAAWKVVAKIVALTFRAELEYRGHFLTMVIFGVAWQASIIVFVTVILGRFPAMGGWDSKAVLLIAAARMLSHGMYELIFGNTIDMSTLVQEGRIDTYLLRPMPVYRQVQLSAFRTSVIGDLLVGISMFTVAVSRLGLDWTPWRIGYMIATIIGGTLLEAAIYTAISGLHLHFPTSVAWSEWIEELMGTFGNYPLSFLPRIVTNAFTFVLPMAFIAYFPAAILTGHGTQLGVPQALAIAAPAVGLAAFIGARMLWNVSLRHYTGVTT